MTLVGQFILLSIGCAVLMTLVLFWSPAETAIANRAARLATGFEGLPRDMLLQRSFRERALTPIIRTLATASGAFTPAQRRQSLQRDLVQAGLRQRHALEVFLALKVGALAAGGVALWPLALGSPVLAVFVGSAVAAIGLIGPDIWLRGQVRRRKTRILLSLPQTLDLITSCVEAGLGFDAAVQQIIPTLGPADADLADELGRFLADIGLGQSRTEALNDLSERTCIDELKGLVAAIVLADTLGQGIAQCLRAQSMHLRTRRRQRAQEESTKAPIKMLVPLVLFIFPALFVVILGPAVIRIMDTLTKTSLQ